MPAPFHPRIAALNGPALPAFGIVALLLVANPISPVTPSVLSPAEVIL